MLQSLQIRSEVMASMTAHALRDPFTECCGVLAGQAGMIIRAFPAINVAESPGSKYEIATREIVSLLREIRQSGLEMLGIYHSHPNGKGDPSETDIAAASYPDAAYFIISTASDAAKPVRAFLIRDGYVTEVDLVCV